jgi:hypothetical protein
VVEKNSPADTADARNINPQRIAYWDTRGRLWNTTDFILQACQAGMQGAQFAVHGCDRIPFRLNPDLCNPGWSLSRLKQRFESPWGHLFQMVYMFHTIHPIGGCIYFNRPVQSQAPEKPPNLEIYRLHTVKKKIIQ